jgi:hypothetical protein
VILGGAGGTPSALALPNATGLSLTTGVTGVLPVANGGTGTAAPGLVQGTNVTISGSWPNQTIAAIAGAYSFAATQRVYARNSAGAGLGEEVSLSQLLDWGSSTQGAILYRGASGWVALTPGTAGQFLRTGGAAANPTWAAPSGSGDALTASPLSQFAATTSAQLRGVISDETGAGFLYFQGGDIGTPSAGVLTSCSGLPLSTGITGLGTGIAAALAVNEGTTGAPVLFNGAGGTPSSLILSNATGLPFGAGISGKPTTLVGYGITDAVGSSDARLSDARTPTAHSQAWSTITATPNTLSGYGIIDGFTEAQVRATPLTGFTSGAGTVAATDSILQAFQKIVGNIANRALAGLIGSSGLTMATNRLAGRGAAGEGAVEELAPVGLVISGGSLATLANPVIGLTGATAGPTANGTLRIVSNFPYDLIMTNTAATLPVLSCNRLAPPVGGSVQVDIRINLSGTLTSIYSTVPSIAVGSGTSKNASGGTLSTAFVNGTGGFTALTIPAAADVHFVCTQIPPGGGAAALQFTLSGRRGS